MPYKDKEKAKQRRREKSRGYTTKYRLAHKVKGLCLNCANPAIEGKNLCDICAKKQIKHILTREKLQTKQGLCTTCNQPIAPHSKRQCFLHLNKHNRDSKKYYRTPEGNNIAKERERNKRCNRKLNNECIHCGMPLNEESRMGQSCLNCYTRRYHTGY